MLPSRGAYVHGEPVVLFERMPLACASNGPGRIQALTVSHALALGHCQHLKLFAELVNHRVARGICGHLSMTNEFQQERLQSCELR